MSVFSSASFVLCVLGGLPGFGDERHGWIGIPSSLGYAIGTRDGVMVLGAILYAMYGAGLGMGLAVAEILAPETASTTPDRGPLRSALATACRVVRWGLEPVRLCVLAGVILAVRALPEAWAEPSGYAVAIGLVAYGASRLRQR